jgi:hypothetical protein
VPRPVHDGQVLPPLGEVPVDDALTQPGEIRGEWIGDEVVEVEEPQSRAVLPHPPDGLAVRGFRLLVEAAHHIEHDLQAGVAQFADLRGVVVEAAREFVEALEHLGVGGFEAEFHGDDAEFQHGVDDPVPYLQDMCLDDEPVSGPVAEDVQQIGHGFP